MTIHPKTSGAAVGGALGTLIVAVLASIHGVDLTAAAYAAIPAFLSTLGAWLVPAPATTPTVPVVVQMHPPEAPAVPTPTGVVQP